MEPEGLGLDEHARLEQLEALGILDTAPEPTFDAIVEVAAALFDMPMAVVAFVDGHRQWFKARKGIAVTETAREVAFCAHVVARGQAVVVLDAHLDETFANNPLVVDRRGSRARQAHRGPRHERGGARAPARENELGPSEGPSRVALVDVDSMTSLAWATRCASSLTAARCSKPTLSRCSREMPSACRWRRDRSRTTRARPTALACRTSRCRVARGSRRHSGARERSRRCRSR